MAPVPLGTFQSYFSKEEDVKTHINWKEYSISFTLLLLAWGGMLRRSFNADTVYHMVVDDFDVLTRIQHGRYLTAMVDFLLGQLGLRTTTHSGVSVLAGLLLMAGTVYLIQELFSLFVSRQIAYTAVTSLIFVNVLASELTMFSEFTAYFGMAYFLAAWGAVWFVRKRFWRALLCIAASCMFYQVGVVFCAMLLSLYIFLSYRGKLCKKAVLEHITGLLMTFGTGFLNMIISSAIVKLLIKERIAREAGFENLTDKFLSMFQLIVDLLSDSMSLLPGFGIPLLFSLLGMGVFIGHRIRKKEWPALFYYLLLLAGMLLMIMAIPFMAEDFNPSPRIVFTFYLFQASIGIIALAEAGGGWRRLIGVASVVYLLVQIVFSQIIVTNHFISNTLDKLYVSMAYEKILEYEEQSGIRVDKLAIIKDIDAPFYYREVGYKIHQINERALGTTSYSLIEVVTGRTFERIPMDQDIFETYFEGKNWDYFDASQQIVFVEDQAYWVIF